MAITPWGAREESAAEQQAAQNEYNRVMGGLTNDYRSATDQNINRLNTQVGQNLNKQSGINNWLNPAVGFGMDQIQKANNAQYGGSGKLLSTANMLATQDAQQRMLMDQYNNAFNMMNTTNNQALGQYNNLANMRNDQAGNIYNVGSGQAAGNLQNAMAAASNKGSLLGDIFGGLKGVGSLASTGVNAYATGQKAGLWGNT